MKCWYTYSRNGILNNSFSTPADIRSDCRVINYKGVLFTVYIAEGDGRPVKYITKPTAAGWSNPLGVGVESRSGAPAVFVFNDKLYVLGSGEHIPRELSISPKLAEYDDLSGEFAAKEFAINFGCGTLVELNGRLYLFYKEPNATTILWVSTGDMSVWSVPQSVKVDGVSDLVSSLDPVAINYQGVIHLVVKDDSKSGSLLIKFDGESAWTRARTFIEQDYSSSPGMAIHNGLLKIVFSGWKNDINSRALYQYGYDGNSLSAPDVSLNLGAKFQVSMAVQDGVLYVMYHGRD